MDIPDDLPTHLPTEKYNDIWTEDVDGEEVVLASDDNGEFEILPPRGDDEPQDERCGVPLAYTNERYGETRYCGALPVGMFPDHNYTYDDLCKNHQYRRDFMKQATELIQHGAFSKNYIVFENALDPLEFIFAIEMFDGLLQQSRFRDDFNVERVVRTIDTSSSTLIDEAEVPIELPIPQNPDYSFQVSELWQAALDEVKQSRMQEVVFTDGMVQEHVADSADLEGRITDTITEGEEHTLHLSISRLTKDIKEHLKNGGVNIRDEDESGVVTFQKNDYTLDIAPDEETEQDEPESLEGSLTATLTDETTDDDPDSEIAVE